MKDLAEIRNDVVGSLLRPAELKQARQRYDEGKLSREESTASGRPRDSQRRSPSGRVGAGRGHGR